MNVTGKRILITGGTSGIGLNLIKQLYENNDISVIARPSPGLEQLRVDFGKVDVFEADLSNLKSVESAAEIIVDTDKGLDIIINNAAVQYTPHFLDDEFRLESIKREIDVNFTSVCTLIYMLLPSLLKSTPSTILNVNSGLALAPKASSAVYCASKGALNIISQSLRYQLENTNVAVRQVFLPLVDTAMTEGRGGGKLSAEYAASEIIKALSASKPAVDIGKVKLLRALQRVSPNIASNIMKST